MAEPTPLQCGLSGLCPRCAAPGLFDGVIRFRRSCAQCGLDFRAFNVGDGPAAFLTTVIGTLAVIAAVIYDLTAHPPWWHHLLIWPPLVIGLTLLGLRVGKGMLVALEYKHKAGEARSG